MYSPLSKRLRQSGLLENAIRRMPTFRPRDYEDLTIRSLPFFVAAFATRHAFATRFKQEANEIRIKVRWHQSARRSRMSDVKPDSNGRGGYPQDPPTGPAQKIG
jgi:Tfp pilus assembly protein PilN